jgi:hypothetical protein
MFPDINQIPIFVLSQIFPKTFSSLRVPDTRNDITESFSDYLW